MMLHREWGWWIVALTGRRRNICRRKRWSGRKSSTRRRVGQRWRIVETSGARWGWMGMMAHSVNKGGLKAMLMM